MVRPLRHRQTKGAATDMPDLTPPRHIPTLPILLKKSGDANWTKDVSDVGLGSGYVQKVVTRASRCERLIYNNSLAR